MMPPLARLAVPKRLALIQRGEETLAYNPQLNVWHRLDAVAEALLRWLRARRPALELAAYLAQSLALAPQQAEETLAGAVKWCLLRQLLYLDKQPVYQPGGDDPDIKAVYWICTQACNLKCDYCYQDAWKARANELTTAEGEDLIRQAHALGAKTFVFTGGEPFARKDLIQLAQYAKSLGLRVNIITNGHGVTKQNAAMLASLFNTISISLDHGVAEHHDKHRGRGSWLRALAAMDTLLEAGAKVDMNSVLSRSGLADIPALLALRRSRRINQHRIVPRFPMGRGGQAPDDDLTPSELVGLGERLYLENRSQDERAGWDAAAHSRQSRKGMKRNHCGAGRSEVSVDPEGWVYPCRLLQYSHLRGKNIRETALREIVHGDEAIREVRTGTTERLEACKTCIIRHYCGGGCRGIHMSFSGSHEVSSKLFCNYLRREFQVEAWSSTGEMAQAAEARQP